MTSVSPDPSRQFLLRARISGRVQGVGFRAFVRRSAINGGLSGWVRNLADGSVEVAATGGASELVEFQQALSAGPALARVSKVEVSEQRELTSAELESGEQRFDVRFV